MKRKKTYAELFGAFLKIGAFTFGGGYAMVPLIEKEVVEKNRWIEEEEILDVLAIAESTPGPIAINCATFIGYKVGGVMGSVVSTLGVVLPSFFVILIISGFYQEFKANPWVNYAFLGIRAGVAVLLIEATIRLARSLKLNLQNIFIIGAAFIGVAFFQWNTILIIITAAFLGIVLKIVRTYRKERGGR